MKRKDVALKLLTVLLVLPLLAGCFGGDNLIEEELTKQVDKLMSENKDLKKENQKLIVELEVAKGGKVDIEGESAELNGTDTLETEVQEEVKTELTASNKKELVRDFLKSNLAKLSGKDDIAPNSLVIKFEGVAEVNLDYTTMDDLAKRLRFSYQVDEDKEVTLKLLSSHEKGEEGVFKEIESPEISEDIVQKNDEEEDVKVLDTEKELPAVDKVIFLADNTITNKFFNFEMAYPKFWYWNNWGAVGNSFTHVSFANIDIEEMEDEIFYLEIVSLHEAGEETDGDNTIYYKDRDDTTSFKMVGPSQYAEILKQMIDSVENIEEE